jgi:hypothetical protein
MGHLLLWLLPLGVEKLLSSVYSSYPGVGKVRLFPDSEVPLGVLGDDIPRMIDKEIPKGAERLQLEPLKGHCATDFKCGFSRQQRAQNKRGKLNVAR